MAIHLSSSKLKTVYDLKESEKKTQLKKNTGRVDQISEVRTENKRIEFIYNHVHTTTAIPN